MNGPSGTCRLNFAPDPRDRSARHSFCSPSVMCVRSRFTFGAIITPHPILAALGPPSPSRGEGNPRHRQSTFFVGQLCFSGSLRDPLRRRTGFLARVVPPVPLLFETI